MELIKSATVKMTAPVAGALPETEEQVEMSTANEDYTVTSAYWNETLTADGKFRAGQVYTATVTLTSKKGCIF